MTTTERNAGCGAGDFGKATDDTPNVTTTARTPRHLGACWVVPA
jgi:hypothetical protein